MHYSHSDVVYNQTTFIDNVLEINENAENNQNNTNLKDEACLIKKLEEAKAEEWVRHNNALFIKESLEDFLDDMVQKQQFSESFFPKTKNKDGTIHEMTKPQKIRKLYGCYLKYRELHDHSIEINTLLVNAVVSIQQQCVSFIKKNFLNILYEWRDYVIKEGKLVNKDGQDTHPNPFPLNFRNWLNNIISIFEKTCNCLEIEETNENIQLGKDILQLITFIRLYLIDYYVQCWKKISESNLRKNKRMQIGTLVKNLEMDMLKMRKILTKCEDKNGDLKILAPSFAGFMMLDFAKRLFVDVETSAAYEDDFYHHRVTQVYPYYTKYWFNGRRYPIISLLFAKLEQSVYKCFYNDLVFKAADCYYKRLGFDRGRISQGEHYEDPIIRKQNRKVVYYISGFAVRSSIYGKKNKKDVFDKDQVKLLLNTFTIAAENDHIAFNDEEESMMDYVAQQEIHEDRFIRPTLEIYEYIWKLDESVIHPNFNKSIDQVIFENNYAAHMQNLVRTDGSVQQLKSYVFRKLQLTTTDMFDECSHLADAFTMRMINAYFNARFRSSPCA